MGIVLKQSLQNMASTYLGFAFGAINTVFLYTKILPDAYYGLVTFILASGAILMPLMAFGVHNTLVKFYSTYSGDAQAGFFTTMLGIPLLGIALVFLILFLFEDAVANVLALQNPLVKGYLWHVLWVGVGMAYFEVFFAWSKVQLKSAFGNLMKEVFGRVGVTVLLLLYYFETIDLPLFFTFLVSLYLVRTLIMGVYAILLNPIQWSFRLPDNFKEVMLYSLLIILGGSAALILLEIDKVMINQFKEIENVAYYGVAVYIATVVIVPSRAMHQITYPLTANLMAEGDSFGLNRLYQKTSLTLFIVSGIIYVLIMLNLKDFFLLLPETYRDGFLVVFLIGLAKVFDSILGNINSILYNSQYYKTILLFGVGLAILTIILNWILIPLYGIEGAAVASFTAIGIFNLAKLIFVKVKFGMFPLTATTFKVFWALLLLAVLFGVFDFGFHPIVNILLKSAIVGVMYIGILFRFELSEDVTGYLSRWLKKEETD
ncbi:MAG: polysaccharide biosynthesis C-terminal domain-containing protein [Bacteroidota bacterium]